MVLQDLGVAFRGTREMLEGAVAGLRKHGYYSEE